jgi:HAD superfamily hydrolase (TIGR01509 family)
MIISAEVHLVKPDPRIFHLTLQRLQVRPAEAVFVDDMAENVEAAAREGLVAILYLDLSQTLDELKRILATD